METFGHGDGFKTITARVYKDKFPVKFLLDAIISKLDFHETLGLEVLKEHAKKWEKMW